MRSLIVFIILMIVNASIASPESTLSSFDASSLLANLNQIRSSGTIKDYVIHTLYDGQQWEQFRIFANDVMPASLQQKYPQIKTYTGYCELNPSNKVAITTYNNHVYITVLSASGQYVIEPLISSSILYHGFYLDQNHSQPQDYLVQPVQSKNGFIDAAECVGAYQPCYPIGDSLYVYRIGIILSWEANADAADGTVEGGLAYVTNLVNQTNLVWIRDWGSKLVLVNNADRLIFTNTNYGYFPSPPFQGSTSFLLDYVIPTLDAIIGPTGYEYGHLIHRGIGGGWAYVGGQAGISIPDYGVFVHELGHQIGSMHNIPQEDVNYAWSIGGTIIGNRDNTVPNSCGDVNGDQYSSHTVDIAVYRQQAYQNSFTNGWYRQPSNNHIPSITDITPSGKVIPIKTPFVLNGNATDVDAADLLTYTWEQNDRATVNFSTPDFPLDNGPSFVSVWPCTKGNTRYFPNLLDLLNNRSTDKEHLPTATRELNFRMIVRDNNPFCGSYTYKNTKIFVDAGSGPFRVLTGNSSVVWTAGTDVTIEWDRAKTQNAPVSCNDVSILLSTDGGSTFNQTLANKTRNDGIEIANIPSSPSENCRIMIKAFDNIFFDINDAPISIHSAELPGIFTTVTPTKKNITTENKFEFTIYVQGLGTVAGYLDLALIDLPTGVYAKFSNGKDNISVRSPTETKLNIENLQSLPQGKYPIVLFTNHQYASKRDTFYIIKTGNPSLIAGKSISFDASQSQEFVIPGLGVTTNSFSFMAWIKRHGTQNEYSSFFSNNPNSPVAAFNFRPDNYLGYHWPGGAWWWDPGFIIPDETWTHVALTVAPNFIKVYMNGEVATHGVTTEPASFMDEMRIGGYQGWYGRHINCEMDEISFWERTLSEDEIRTLKYHPLTGAENGLLAYYQFNNQTLTDIVGSINGSSSTQFNYPESDYPFGIGVTSIKSEQQGIVNFPNTDLELNFISHYSALFSVTKFNTKPQNLTTLPEHTVQILNNYWILERFGKNDFQANMNAKIDYNILANYVNYPQQLILFHRLSNADAWQPISSGTAIDLNNNTITFAPIRQLGQFYIGANENIISIENPQAPFSIKLASSLISDNRIIIKLSHPSEYKVYLNLYDLEGRIIESQVIQPSFENNNIAISINNAEITSGLYYLSIKYNNYSNNYKIVVID